MRKIPPLTAIALPGFVIFPAWMSYLGHELDRELEKIIFRRIPPPGMEFLVICNVLVLLICAISCGSFALL